jgi:tetratricopeptide (TPR) repeat protein
MKVLTDPVNWDLSNQKRMAHRSSGHASSPVAMSAQSTAVYASAGFSSDSLPDRRSLANAFLFGFSKKIGNIGRTLLLMVRINLAHLASDRRESRFSWKEKIPMKEALLVILFALLVQPAEAASLRDDGSVGKVLDTQGMTGLRPPMQSRWTPLTSKLTLKPGDWIRTGVRGANATRIRLHDGTGFILGPGTLLELVPDGAPKLISGTAEVTAPPGASAVLQGPDGKEVTVKTRQILRVADKQLHIEKTDPGWLLGFKGAIPQESLGSLIANVDGRDVPLTIGYHRVKVIIRDQIARTTIEESFVNHTKSQLEGVFNFPLPADASIANFGMWIGGELVEADVVEKQRAREIYETILREKRDPGLLEWSGGNLFKARVYPIFPHSEKRVTITYTQVLPRVGNKVRYSYALNSEMLRSNPLRELELDVRIHSSAPIAKVTCPSHPARIDSTEHSGHVEFTAEEYVPKADFSVDFTVEASDNNLVIVPHRRGDDGYLLALFTPGGDAAEERPVIPDGEPLELVLVVDTSGSMRKDARQRQAALVEALLSSLGSQDKFQVLACDVHCRRLFEGSAEATDERIEAVLTWLANTVSLGWTDLEMALKAALDGAPDGAHLIYIGDGITTAGEGDAAAVAARFDALYGSRTVTCHAIAVASTYEDLVLRRIASLGGGSVRVVNELNEAGRVASELLTEVTVESLRNLTIRFEGLETAATYPRILPNLPTGRQQVILGRYQPSGKDSKVVAIIQGTLDGKKVSVRQSVELPEGDAGNSFIPRLWARQYLDDLISEGRNSGVRDQIIALSEEYRIMTPYTSFLVLESDADRQRFGVKRRFRMRDGEKFFAKARKDADFELQQKQMKRAGEWRTGLRNQMVSQLMSLGRRYLYSQYSQYGYGYGGDYGGGYGQGWADTGMVSGGGMSGPVTTSRMSGRDSLDLLSREVSKDSRFDFESKEMSEQQANYRYEFSDETVMGDYKSADPAKANEMINAINLPMATTEGLKLDDDAFFPADAPMVAEEPPMMMEKAVAGKRSRAVKNSFAESVLSSDKSPKTGYLGGDIGHSLSGFGAGGYATALNGAFAAATPSAGEDLYWGRGFGTNPAVNWQGDPYWFSQLFPYLSPAPVAPVVDEKSVTATWQPEALALSKALVQRPALMALEGGLKVTRLSSYPAKRPAISTPPSESRTLLSATGWLTVAENHVAGTQVRWCDEDECAVFMRPLLLGRFRKAGEKEHQEWPLSVGNYALYPLHKTFLPRDFDISVQAGKSGTSRIILEALSSAQSSTEIIVDTKRNVVLEMSYSYNGKLGNKARFADFVRVAGGWWPTRIENEDAEGRVTMTESLSYEVLDKGAFISLMKAERKLWSKVFAFSEPLMSVLEAKAALAKKSPSHEAHLRMFIHFANTNQWPKVKEHVTALMAFTDGKPGVRWLEFLFLQLSRDHQQLHKQLLEVAAKLVGSSGPDEYFLARHLENLARGILAANEMMALQDLLKPLYERVPKNLFAMKNLGNERVGYLQQLGRSEDAFKLAESLAVEYRSHFDVQNNFLYQLTSRGDYDRMLEWVNSLLAEKGQWELWEEDSLRSHHTQYLSQFGKFDELHKYLEEWMAVGAAQITPYQQYLSTTVMLGKFEAADDIARSWLALASKEINWYGPDGFRVQAATYHALGQGYMNYSNTSSPEWFPELVKLALAIAERQEANHLIWQILNNQSFNQSEVGRSLLKSLMTRFLERAGTMPVSSLSQYVQWLIQAVNLMPNRPWQPIHKVLLKRWESEKVVGPKNMVGGALVQFLGSVAATDELLVFLRRQWKEGDKASKSVFCNRLFSQLLMQPWSEAVATELFALINLLWKDNPNPHFRLWEQVSALFQVNDWVASRHYSKALETATGLHEMTRTKLAEFYRDAQLAGWKKTMALLDANRKTLPDGLHPWIDLELAYWGILAGRPHKELWVEAIAGLTEPLLVSATALPEALEKTDRQRRWLDILDYLAIQKQANPEAVAELARRYRKAATQASDRHPWRVRLFRLLVAADRVDELEQALAVWMKDERPDLLWRVTYAWLLAETGRVTEAVKLFEDVRDRDELTATEWRVLADWYLVLGEKKKRDDALVKWLMTFEEWGLNSWLQNQIYALQAAGEGAAGDLDPNIIQAFAALFRKSQYPSNYTWMLGEYIRHSRDWRLYGCLGEGMIGHTVQQVYPFLQGLYYVLEEIRDEASADAALEQIASLHKKVKSDPDKRALDLLEMIVEIKAASVLNSPEGHAKAAVAAMRRASKGKWQKGEEVLMAELLANQYAVSNKTVKAEQRRQLAILNKADVVIEDALRIADAYARLLVGDGMQEEALRVLENALEKTREHNGGKLLWSAQSAVTSLVHYYQNAGRFKRAEVLLMNELALDYNDAERAWLENLLFGMYNRALNDGGMVSFGKREQLYREVRIEMEKWLARTSHTNRQNVIRQIAYFHQSAHRVGIAGVGKDFKVYAWHQLDDLKGYQPWEHHAVISELASTLYHIVGAREGLALLVAALEREPSWFRMSNQDGIQHHGYLLGQWRAEARGLGELEQKLLTLFLETLTRDLEKMVNRGCSTTYHKCSGFFWTDKEKRFGKVAEEVMAKHLNSGQHIEHIANYFASGLEDPKRAIAVLLKGLKKKLLTPNGEYHLVSLLQQEQDYKKSIPILKSLVDAYPDTLEDRRLLLIAYARTKAVKQARRILKDTRKYYEEKKQWQAWHLAILAQACVDGGMDPEAVKLYEELIPLYQETAYNRGIGDGSLAAYYTSLATVYSRLGRTALAVEAAGGAIVAWGNQYSARLEATGALLQVLTDAKDLGAYVASLDSEAEKSGMDKPIIRKAVGQVYLNRKACKKAVTHLVMARESQPYDAAIHEHLVKAFDCTGQKEEARAALLAWAELTPHRFDLYRQLGDRFGDDAVGAERAYTGMVESMPEEAESHRTLAELREGQERWVEAITQWEQVVRIRSLEPDGYMHLAAALMHEKMWLRAGEVLAELMQTKWPSHFGDVKQKASELLKKLERKKR